MIFACLATFICVCAGVSGIIVACIDINRFNFGLYLALLSVVGTTISVAFWIVKPKACDNPKCAQRLINHLQRSLSATIGGVPKGHSSKFVVCSSERSLLSSSFGERHGRSTTGRQPKKKCPSTVGPLSMLSVECHKPAKPEPRLRRSSTWCTTDEQNLTLKVDVPQKTLSWPDGYSATNDLQLFSGSEPSSNINAPQSSNFFRKCNRCYGDKITKAPAMNFLPLPVSLVHTCSAPEVCMCTNGCTHPVKGSRSLNFYRKLHVYRQWTDDEDMCETSSEMENSGELSTISDRSGTFELRLIPYPAHSGDQKNYSWITHSSSSGSDWNYQLLQKMSSSQSLSTLV